MVVAHIIALPPSIAFLGEFSSLVGELMNTGGAAS